MTDSSAEGGSKASPHPYATLLLVLLAVSIFISICAGVPTNIPSVALGSSFLLYVERAIALFAGSLLIVVILVEAWRGNLPVEMSGRGLKYDRLKEDSLQGVEETKRALQALAEAILEERKAREEATKP